MKNLLLVLLGLPFSPLSGEDCTQVRYHIDLNHFEARESTGPHGSGICLKELISITEINEDLYELRGVVISSHTGFPVENASVLVGNLEESSTLRLLGKSDQQGEFKIRISNQDDEQIAAEAKLLNLGLVYQHHNLSHEEMYQIRKYIYFGKTGIDLYQFEIPYDKAEQVVSYNSD